MIYSKKINFIISCLLMVMAFCGQIKAQQSVLNKGTWFKLAVNSDGVYKITYAQLKKIGVDPDKINPQNIKIYGNGGGMLPQANSISRINDLEENSIFINGETDGKFNKEDFILFYGEGTDLSRFSLTRNIFFYQKNIYDDKNYYFLTVADSPGKRVEVNETIGASSFEILSYDAYSFHELDQYNELHSGREWFGENFYIDAEQEFKIDGDGIVENSLIKVVSDVMGQSTSPSSLKLLYNGVEVAEQFISPITTSKYGSKGRHQHDTLMFNATTVSAGSSADKLKYQFIKQPGAKAYLDYYLISYKRKLKLYGDQTIFRASQSLANVTSRFEIDQVSGDCSVWDITDPLHPNIQPYASTNNKGIFSTSTTQLKEFIVFNNNISAPEFIEKILPQDLHGISTPNLVIVTSPSFKEAAERLATHRQNHSGWTTAVVTTEEVYNEFSSGRQDVSAIRDFVKYLYNKNPDELKSLILFGRSSYDYKNRVFSNTNFIPTYESRNSLEPLETYSSDDYYAFLENNEGEWSEDPVEDQTLDIGVGRFPVKTLDEANNVVSKIIDYDTNVKSFGRWRKEIVFVADDGDGNIHQSQSDQLARQVELNHPEVNTKRIFLDAYQQVIKPSGEIAPDVNKSIEDAMDRGSIIINYTGHGGEKIWSEEKIFDDLLIDQLDNKTYPLFVTATCEFGRNDDPGVISSAELSVIKKNAGAIGMVSTTRPVSSNTNFELNKAFYETLFITESNSFLTLGEVFRRTKNLSTSGISNRNFSLLGDPSMKLAIPIYDIIINEIKNEEGTDTLKALSTITVKGEVHKPSGEKSTDFNGNLEATLFDKESSFRTLGNQNPVFNFKQWSNVLFRGATSIKEGDFEFQFIVPKDIAYQVGKGKLSLYASDKTKKIDAIGSELDFIVGKSYVNPTDDNTPPFIQLFMGDTTFQSGGVISKDSYLIATLKDDSGINISNYGIGNNLLATMDGNETFILNDYYQADVNTFTSGRMIFRMRNLPIGKHSIILKAWDTHNNGSAAKIDFIVSDGASIKIETFSSYPNPFQESTTLFFTHNRSGDDLAGSLMIYNITGEIVKSFDFSISSSNYKVELLEFGKDTSEKKLSAGLYLARLTVRSVTNGSKNEQVTKLFMVN